MYVPRNLQTELLENIAAFPAVAVLGPRRCGKSTLAKALLANRENGLYLDLEKPSDLAKLTEPELFLELNAGKLVCLDEIQRAPELFRVLRAVIDEKPDPGRFLILGSASQDLIRQSSETLAGRISYLELTPFLYSELAGAGIDLRTFHLNGGFPESILVSTGKQSERWRRNFIRTFLERDLGQLGLQIPAGSIERLWRMCAHSHGQLLNQSQLGAALGVSHTTVRKYLDILSRTFMVRLLPPFLPNLNKRLVKSQRIYIRDSGILHTLLGISTYEDLLGHPVFGASWEGMVIENILGELPEWQGFFYRTAAGSEIDLVLEKGKRRIAIECKASAAPIPSPGFWNALEDLKISQARIVAPVRDQYPFKNEVLVCPLQKCVAWLKGSS
jgi:predicted AAA+ superfamily ATPase